jgi:uncharacterized phage-associated protein
MTIQHQSFSLQHGLEALLYVIEKLQNPTIHEVLKIRYFADKIHLGRYGALASGDDYVAMEFGPVASNSYNLIKAAKGVASQYINPAFTKIVDGAICIKDDGKSLVAERSARLEYLSAAETECLDQAIKEYGGWDFGKRTKTSHDAAYDKAWKVAVDSEALAAPMNLKDIALTLENADDIIGYLSE